MEETERKICGALYDRNSNSIFFRKDKRLYEER